jgi:hypothetical protein
MKARILSVSILILIIGLLLIGCIASEPYDPFAGSEANLVIPIESDTTIPESTTITLPPTTVTTTKIVTTTIIPTGIILKNAEINGNDIKAGMIGSYKVFVENTTNEDVVISIYFKEPDDLREGYSFIGNQANNWLSIQPANITIPANGINDAVVTLAIPEDAVLPDGKLEFWLSYKYVTGGFMDYILNQRWLLNRS